MKITQTRLKQLIQEELAAVQETFGSKPPPPSASREEVNKVVAELFNVAANLEALGEDFHTDANTLDTWIGAFMEKHKVLKEDELEEGAGQVYCKDRKAPGGFRRQPPCPPGYDQQQVADKKTGPAGGAVQSDRYASGPKPSIWE